MGFDIINFKLKGGTEVVASFSQCFYLRCLGSIILISMKFFGLKILFIRHRDFSLIYKIVLSSYKSKPVVQRYSLALLGNSTFI